MSLVITHLTPTPTPRTWPRTTHPAAGLTCWAACGAFLAVTARVGLSWMLPACLYRAAVTIALTMIDPRVRALPDQIVLPS